MADLSKLIDLAGLSHAYNKLLTLINQKAGTSAATTSAAGLMSAADKTKLDGIAAGATANALFVVTLSGNDTNGYTADKTFAQIYEAYNAGNDCVCVLTGRVYPLAYVASAQLRFAGVTTDSEDYTTIFKKITFTALGAITVNTTDFTTDLGAASASKALVMESATAAMPSSANWFCVAYGNGKFVAVAHGSDKAAYSTDGITWTATTMPSSANWYCVTYGDGVFVALAEGNTVAYSTDGITWTAGMMMVNANWRAVTWGIYEGETRFIAVASDNASIAISADGQTWVPSQISSAAEWTGIAYGNGKYVAVSHDAGIVYGIGDGTWTAANIPTSSGWYAVAYGNGKFVAMGSGSKVAYSADGITWTEAAIGQSFSNPCIAYGDGKFVAISSGNKRAAYSEDGILWKVVYMPTANGVYRGTYGNRKFVAVNYGDDTVALSTSGESWTTEGCVIKQNGVDVTEKVIMAIG